MKYLDLNEFKSSGLLQEVNRQFFHPLGLALEVRINDGGEVLAISGIQDHRDSPEGLTFGQFNENHVRRAENVIGEQRRRAVVRSATLGHNIEPIPGVNDAQR